MKRKQPVRLFSLLLILCMVLTVIGPGLAFAEGKNGNHPRQQETPTEVAIPESAGPDAQTTGAAEGTESPADPPATAQPGGAATEPPADPSATAQPGGEATEPPADPSATAQPGGEAMEPPEEDDEQTEKLTRSIADSETDTYVFYDGEGNVIREQLVAAGDTLFQPVSLPALNGETFLGWYVGDTKLDFGASGQLTVARVTGGATVEVRPRYARICYVTFYEEDRSTILSRRPVEIPSGADSAELDFSDLSVISSNPQKEFVFWADEQDTRVDSPVAVSSDLSLYPVFETGHWLRFDANRIPAMAGVDVDYTAPQFVREGAVTAAPVSPKASSPRFVFTGWYADPACTEPFAFGGELAENTLVYAGWTESAVPFKIMVWTQSLSDDKDAADKTYDPYRVYDSNDHALLKAAAGSTVSLESWGGSWYYQSGGSYVDIAAPSGAFYLNAAASNSSAEVSADGSTTLNLFYDRRLLSIEFNSNGYSGAVNQTFTGLYGQTLARNGYEWPYVSGLRWMTTASSGFFQGGTTVTFMDVFNFDEFSETQEGGTLLRLYARRDSGSSTVNHYRQNPDGAGWPDEPTHSTTSGGDSFEITNKYTGFTASQYRVDGGVWRTATAGSTVVRNFSTLDIRYSRSSYTVDFYDGNVRLAALQSTKRFEAPLADLANVAAPPSNPAMVTFGGWAWVPGVTNPADAVDFSFLTMPAGNLNLYAIWVPLAYRVVLDANGGAMDNAQALDFWVPYATQIDDTWMSRAEKERHQLVGWYTRRGAAWNFSNGVTASLCDEGPTYDPEYDNWYYTVYLTAKWRLDETVSLVYDVTENGSGSFADANAYMQDAWVRILDGAPVPLSATQFFVGWLDAAHRLHQPGEAFELSEDLIADDANGKPAVRLTAQYSTVVPKTTITYHLGTPTRSGATAIVDGPFEWNQTVTLRGADTFERTGYRIIGWNSDATAAGRGEVEFGLGTQLRVSAMNTVLDENLVGNNDLYAALEPVVRVTSGTHEWTRDGAAHTWQQYLVSYGDTSVNGAEGQLQFNLAGAQITVTPTGLADTGVIEVTDSCDNSFTVTAVKDGVSLPITSIVFGSLIVRAPTATVDIQVQKQWIGPAASSATFLLYADNVQQGTLTLTENDNWSGAFANVPTHDPDNGYLIRYSVEEVQIPGYRSSWDIGSEGYSWIFINTNIETIDIQVQKQWVGTPLDKVTILLDADGVQVGGVELSADENWRHTFHGLQRYDTNGDGHEIVYKVDEERLEGYTKDVTGSAATGFVIVNTEDTVTEKIDVSVQKRWVGPAQPSVTVSLMNGNTVVDTAELNANGNWQHLFRGLDRFDASGTEIQYSVAEAPVTGYASRVEGDMQNGFVVVNEWQEKLDVSVQKRWVGPALGRVIVYLWADGYPAGYCELSPSNGWSYVFRDLDRYDGAREIVYSVSEQRLVGYSFSVTGNQTTGFVITNTRITDPGNSPKTGDRANLPLYAALLLLSGAGLAGTLVFRRGKKSGGR